MKIGHGLPLSVFNVCLEMSSDSKSYFQYFGFKVYEISQITELAIILLSTFIGNAM